MLGTKSKQITLLAARVYSVTHALYKVSFSTMQMFRTKPGPKLSVPTVKNGRKSLSLIGVRGGDGGYP